MRTTETLRDLLIVEDNPLDRELITEAFSELRLLNKIVAVSDGTEAIDYLRYKGKYETREKINPVVVLLDIKMPKMSGIELLKIIRTDTKLKSMPVVMLTSSKEDSDLKTSYELGVNAYVLKPIDFKDFSEAVKNVGLFWGIINQPPANSTYIS